MRKTIRKYLEECRTKACLDMYISSKTYSMDTPADGKDKEFNEARRDLEMVDELIAITDEFPNSDKPDL
jgi:hypothetical protein